MRRNSFVLWSTSAMAVALAATPAAAQTDPAAQPDPAVTAQTNPADQAAGDSEAIVVTGIRRSLQSAKNIKKNNPQIVDAIVAEDIGKLPDIAVSDTAARIPGIQVERGGGEAGRVLVRGLDRAFYTTTYNGREIFTAETRSVALQDFPAGAIGAIEAYKTSAANLIEPGIAGLINVRSRRPFDFKDSEIAGSAWVLNPRQSGSHDLNGNLLATTRWKAGDGEMGALLGFSYTSLHYLDSIISNAYFVAPGPNGGRMPDWPFIEYNEAKRSRPSLNGSFQWRPTPDLEFYVEGLWQGFRHKIQDRHFEQPIWGGASYTNIVMREGTNLIESGTVTNPFRGEGWQGGTYNKTNTYQFAAGGSYDAGPLRITGDIARTNSTFTGSTASVDYVLCGGNFNCGQTIDFVIGAPGDNPSFAIRNFDPSDPANFAYRGFYEQDQQAKGDDWQARLDFEYEPGIAFIPKIQAGVRYVDRGASRRFGDRYSTMNYGTPISGVPLDYELFGPGFHGADDKPFPLTWLAPTYDSIRNGLADLRAFAGFPAGPPPANPLATFHANEKSYAGYAQLNYAFDLGQIPVDGQLGIRAVNTKRGIQGTQRTFPGGIDEPLDLHQSDTDWLPNASLRAHLTDQLQLRLAATKTRTRPQFGDLNPSVTINPPPGCTVGQTNCERTASGGNPFLKPLTAKNYDASLEYYFSANGFMALTVFHHDLKGFVTPSSYIYPTPDPTGLPIRVFAPINSDKGHVNGFEAQASTFFDFAGFPDWARSFGVQANVTHLNAKAKYPNFGDETDMITRPLLGVSKWSYNLIGMFEHGPMSARLAYNWRSKFWGDYSERNDFSSNGQPYVLRQLVHPTGRLDLSASYNVTDNFTLFGDWTNILSRGEKTDLVRIDPSGTRFDPNGPVVDFAWRSRYEERILSLGARFRFGGRGPRVAEPAPAILPPPPPAPAVEAPPVIEQPAPPPPRPQSGERG